MAEEPRPFNEIMLDVLAESRSAVTAEPAARMSAEDIEAGLADVWRRAALTQDEAAGHDAAMLSAELVAFLIGEGTLTHDQQRRVFTDPALRQSYQQLKRTHGVRLPSEIGDASTGGADRFLGMPAQIAAASAPAASSRRRLDGGWLSIEPVGIDHQVYLIFDFDDPEHACRTFVVERHRDARLVRIALPPAEDGQIVIIKDLAIPAEAELVALLKDPAVIGTFLR